MGILINGVIFLGLYLVFVNVVQDIRQLKSRNACIKRIGTMGLSSRYGQEIKEVIILDHKDSKYTYLFTKDDELRCNGYILFRTLK